MCVVPGLTPICSKLLGAKMTRRCHSGAGRSTGAKGFVEHVLCARPMLGSALALPFGDVLSLFYR